MRPQEVLDRLRKIYERCPNSGNLWIVDGDSEALRIVLGWAERLQELRDRAKKPYKVYKVYNQNWTENSFGEQSNGPPMLVGTYETLEEAKTKKQEISFWSDMSGNWVWIKEVPLNQGKP